MKILNLILFLTILPIKTAGQERDLGAALGLIEKNKENIERIRYYESNSEHDSNKDALTLTNSQEFENVILTLYHRELAMEEQVDYYVVGMDVPLLELIDIEEYEYHLKLIFSRKCDFNAPEETQIIELNFASGNGKGEILKAFKDILKVRNSYHQSMHKLKKCSLESR